MDAMSGAGIGMGMSSMIGDMLDAGLTAKFQAKEAKKGRNFAEAVGKNKIRWAVNDMKRAGINPLTMFMGGGSISGGVSGGGSIASISRSPGSVRSAAEASRAAQQSQRESEGKRTQREMTDMIKEQAFAYRASAEKDFTQANLNEQSARESKQREVYYSNLGEVEGFNATIRGLDLAAAMNRYDVHSTKYWGQFLEGMRQLKGAINPLEATPSRRERK